MATPPTSAMDQTAPRGAPKAGKGLAAAALSAAIALVGVSCERPVEPDAAVVRPNVLLIVLDTTRADRCGYVGYDRDTSPTLDALAAEGAAFTNAWSPAGWTGPAHASLFTGLRPEHHRMWLGGDFSLSESQVTLAEILRADGYRTGSFSCNTLVSREFGLVQGFETVESVRGADKALDGLAEDARLRLGAWIDRAPEPWFAFLNVMEPHLPYSPPWRAERRFVSPNVDSIALNAMREFNHEESIAHITGTKRISRENLALLSDLYDAEIATADAAIGRLVEALRQSGTLDNTVVVVVADHGENLGEHGLVAHRFSLHRTIRHVPVVLRYPPLIEPGRVEHRTVRLEDVAPTILELCNFAIPADLDGERLTGDVGTRLARGIQGPIPADYVQRVSAALDGASLAAFTGGIRAVFDGRYHLIRHDDGREELYDVLNDPTESSDLIGERWREAARLRLELPDA